MLVPVVVSTPEKSTVVVGVGVGNVGVATGVGVGVAVGVGAGVATGVGATTLIVVATVDVWDPSAICSEIPTEDAPEPEGGREEVIRKEYINPPSNYAPSTIKSHHSRHHSSHHSSHHSTHRSRSHSTRAPSPSSATTITQRQPSPARTHRSHRDRGRRIAGAGTVVEERKTVV